MENGRSLWLTAALQRRSDLWPVTLLSSAVLLVHTVGRCYYPLTGDDGPSAGVTVAVVEADLPGPPAQRSLNASYYPGQLRSGPTLCTERRLSETCLVRERCSRSSHSLFQYWTFHRGFTEVFMLAENAESKVQTNLLTKTLQRDNLPCHAALPKWE